MNQGQSFSKKLFSRKNLQVKKTIIVLVVFLGIVVSVLCNTYINMNEMEKQLQLNLKDVAHQNAEVLHATVHSEYDLLVSLATQLEDVTPDNIMEKLKSFEIYLESFQLKRFAFCFPDGMTYSTDNGTTDLSYREFYKRGMNGACSITGTLSDALREEHNPVNVMTIPVYSSDNNIIGVFGLAYDTSIFNNVMQISSFDNQGYSCIINEYGEIMAVSDNMLLNQSQDFFDTVEKADMRNIQALSDLREKMELKEEVSGILYLSEKSYYSCVPIKLMNGCVTWYVLTIVPSDVLNQRISPILTNQYITCFMIGIFVVAGALILIYFIKDQQKQIMHYAYEDSLTGGPNYTKFFIDMQKRHNSNGYLIIMGIANFDNITIAAGENASKAMILETWQIINNSLKQDELAAHVRDDLFLLFLVSDDDKQMLDRMSAISELVNHQSKDFFVYGIHTEYGIYRMSGMETIENAYSRAEMARKYAANSNEKQYAFYSETDRLKVQQEKQLEEHFPIAIANKEFEVWYQPKYSAEECSIVGSEALVRWRDSDGKLISPGQFIPLFERNGLIMKLDEYMFANVCRQQKKWLDSGKTIYPVSVNLSRASLCSIDIVKRYSEIMQESGIAPEYVQIEVTESIIGANTNIYEILNRFRNMGIKILMDDFGTGYSSLTALSSQHFDTLKLDKSLIDHIGDKDGEVLLYHVIRMGQQMKLHITAEGVETKSQLEFLQNLKCDDIQGFYFSKPLPTGEYEAILSKNS